MVEICQNDLPIRPWEDTRLNRLPGLNPTAPGEWLIQDDAYAAQMAYRVTLMRDHQDAVHRLSPDARAAARELLDTVLDELANTDGFQVSRTEVRCPDGRVVKIDERAPLLTCGALVQEDFVIMQKQGDEHVLTGAILCFPASWSLAQKYMRPMLRIHKPVAAYTDDIARRVQMAYGPSARCGAPIICSMTTRSFINPEPKRTVATGRARGQNGCVLSVKECGGCR